MADVAISKTQLKEDVVARIDARAEAIVELGETIFRNPETGYKEFETAGRVQSALERLGLKVKTGLGITGLRAEIDTGRPGPTVALLGELDALVVPGHPNANPTTNAAHACGHNAQVAGMVGAAMALTDPETIRNLSGRIVFMAVPAEEFVEIQYRQSLAAAGKIEFLGGKPELVRLGVFDDIDMAILIHTSSPEAGDAPVEYTPSGNGFVAKVATFVGRAAHVARPEKGVNALKAAILAMNAIDAIRDTFPDADAIRVHPIITRGGDLVNVVPSHATLEMYVRGKTLSAIAQQSAAVDRALKAGALGLGASVEIKTVPGYAPFRNYPALADVFTPNAERVFGPGSVRWRTDHGGGSTDMGDLALIMPILQPGMKGATGTAHGTTWHIADPVSGYLAPAKTLAMTTVDLLWGEAEVAREVIAREPAPMTRAEYLAFQRGLDRTERFGEDPSEALPAP
jgi:amidohydrolase